LILASISRDGESPPFPSFEPLFAFFMVVVAFFMGDSVASVIGPKRTLAETIRQA
jgi:hypothetical protein